MMHSSFEKRECFVKVLDRTGNIQFRYKQSNNLIVKHNLASVSMLNYGDFTTDWKPHFCQRDGRPHLTFALCFKDIEAPLLIECLNSN